MWFKKCIIILLLSSVFIEAVDNNVTQTTQVQSEIIISPALLVALESASFDSIGLDWLPAQGSGIHYEVHISKDKSFTPNTNTLKLTTNDTSATISGLIKNTRYYAIIVTATSSDKKVSGELSVKTSHTTMLLRNTGNVKQINIIKSNTRSFSNPTIVSETQIQTKDTLVAGDIVYDTGKNPYLRKVISSTVDTYGNTIAQTKKTKLRDIYQ